ncbi:MAG TPA: SpoIIE family protein phosphatase [Terracidiphilus sp.]|nr:SpoIIE family protein phosphatase [Terracidiphilus sp.]
MCFGFAVRLLAMLVPLAYGAWLPAQSYSLVDGREPLVSLDGPWRFHPGDSPMASTGSPIWATPGFDDSGWALINGGQSWSDQGYPGLSGYAWYRFTVTMPASQNSTSLLLPPILTSFQVFVDGKPVGSAGRMPPTKLLTAEISYHMFSLTQQAVRSARTVQVAIRVWHSPLWASYVGGGPLEPGSLAGDPKLLATEQSHHRRSRSVLFVDYYAYSIASGLVGLVILCLFLMRTREREYMWFAAILLAQSADNALAVIFQIYAWPPLQINDFVDGILVAIEIAATLLFFSKVLKIRVNSLGRVLLLLVALSPFSTVLYWPGWASASASAALQQALLLPAVLWIFYFLVQRALRGNLDAILLLVPTLLDVGFNSVNNLAIVFDQAGWINSPEGVDLALRFQPFTMHLSILLHLIFLLTMLVFLIRRFTFARRQEERMAGELNAARQVQQVLLPDEADQCQGFKVEWVYQPANEVGGDFFQQIADGEFGMFIVVGDVSGKGLPAAMLVSVLVGAIRAEAARGTNPSNLLSSLNNRMMGRSQGGFTTCLAAHISADGVLTMANAGHLAPYLNGIEIDLPSSLPLGIVAELRFESIAVTLASGNSLTFVSDGVVEARARNGELFGFDRTRELSRLPAEAIARAAQQFGQEDDITVVTVEFAGVRAPALV